MPLLASAITSWWRSHVTLKVFGSILLGQLVSFSLAIMSLTSSLVTELGVDAPLTLGMFAYATLALVYGSILLYRHHKPLVSWYWYLLLAFADLQGNYLVNKAYQYSSITSVSLLDCWTIPWVIILTWIFLGTRYSLWQLSGAVICVLGLCLVLLSDSGDGGGAIVIVLNPNHNLSVSGGSRPILGDVLVIAGTIFFGISNVGEEFCVKKKDRVEVVSMLGVYGFLVSIVEVSIIELKTLESVKWSAEIVLAFVGYALSSFMFYTITPLVLKMSGATLFNLSILTADVWAVVLQVFFYHQGVYWLYFLSFAVVVIGLIIYSTTEKNFVPAPTTEDGNLNAEYQVLNDENTASGNVSSAS